MKKGVILYQGRAADIACVARAMAAIQRKCKPAFTLAECLHEEV